MKNIRILEEEERAPSSRIRISWFLNMSITTQEPCFYFPHNQNLCVLKSVEILSAEYKKHLRNPFYRGQLRKIVLFKGALTGTFLFASVCAGNV